ncbi:hypothetical protein LHYA1_G006670 [Lachnellula hyalina]|uniref:Uncharacterized protein n=1 Tax=Lachnellula hyalina TaxID=1316788 RepID=A0A8H8QZG2_9HELO|nr:uncharacterized protein LHYA1_G006670 [Lachnellula hyalina]TVY24124.1 hypothetical protein LHYA1_G006670 [Lachnellula hyalina]
MPFSLRGIDAITFSVFRALGLKVLVAPVLGDEAWDEWEQAREEKWMQKIYGDEPMAEGGVVEEEEENAGDKTRVGKSWHKMRMVSGEGGVGLKVGEDPTPFTNYHYPLHVLPSVTWLNESTENWEIAMVNLKNISASTSGPSEIETEIETEIMWQYSHAAIFIEIPASEERKK